MIIEEFFQIVRDPEAAVILFKARDLVEDSNKSKIIRVEIEDINARLIEYLARNPAAMRELDPRRFEELVGSLFRERGYEVEITPQTRDGGKDIVLIGRSDVGAAMTLVECKRYQESNRVGVEVVRGLYGVVEELRATRGLIATTSYFTSEAKALRDKLAYRMELADFDVLSGFLSDWSAQRRRSRN